VQVYQHADNVWIAAGEFLGDQLRTRGSYCEKSGAGLAEGSGRQAPRYVGVQHHVTTKEERMTKLLSLGVAIGVSFLCVAAAQSMPLAPLEQA
jgi:hypothetical protein